MTKLERDYVKADFLHADWGTFDRILHNAPKTDPLLVWEPDGRHVVFRSDPDEIGPLALQAAKDPNTVQSGDGGYAAAMHHLTATGERIATVSADVTSDGHNHWGVYTNSGGMGDGSDSQPTKRLNIHGGANVVPVDWYGVSDFKIGPRGAGDGTEQAKLIIEGESGTSPYLRINENGSSKYVAQWDSGKNHVRLLGYNGTVTDFRLTDDGAIRIPSGGPAGAGEIQFGHNGARIYLDSNGSLVAENEAGSTTTLI